jgi:uncharacterized membrane protein
MLILILGLIVFLGAHSVSILARPQRDALVARLGPGGYRAIYSIISLVGFVLIVWGYDEARLTTPVLWNPPMAMRHVALLTMIPVFPLLFAAYLPGRIKTVVKHPMLTAVKFWALAHLLANGTLADVLLFGSLLAWAVADRISAKRRGVVVDTAGGRRGNDVIALVLGLVTYAIFVLYLHEWWIGVSPLG